MIFIKHNEHWSSRVGNLHSPITIFQYANPIKFSCSHQEGIGGIRRTLGPVPTVCLVISETLLIYTWHHTDRSRPWPATRAPAAMEPRLDLPMPHHVGHNFMRSHDSEMMRVLPSHTTNVDQRCREAIPMHIPDADDQ